MQIIAHVPHNERDLVQKAIHKNLARRFTAIKMLHQGDRISDVARTLC